MKSCPSCGVTLMPVLFNDHGYVVAAMCPAMCLIVRPPRADNLTVYYRPPTEWFDAQLELTL